MSLCRTKIVTLQLSGPGEKPGPQLSLNSPASQTKRSLLATRRLFRQGRPIWVRLEDCIRASLLINFESGWVVWIRFGSWTIGDLDPNRFWTDWIGRFGRAQPMHHRLPPPQSTGVWMVRVGQSENHPHTPIPGSTKNRSIHRFGSKVCSWLAQPSRASCTPPAASLPLLQA